MSEITVNPSQRQASVSDSATNVKRAAKTSAQAESQVQQNSSVQSDTVTLTASAQLAPSGAASADLSEEAANEASVNLRQQLGVNSLSVSAKQNQSILSLLRG